MCNNLKLNNMLSFHFYETGILQYNRLAVQYNEDFQGIDRKKGLIFDY
jgi:hypothetical protein